MRGMERKLIMGNKRMMVAEVKRKMMVGMRR
jgi:hypothetical protein